MRKQWRLVDNTQAMRVNNMKYKILFISSVLISFFFNNALANNKFYSCLEKITEVRSSTNSEYFVGKEYGYSFIKLDLKSSSPIATIYFKSVNSGNKSLLVIKNKQTKNTTLGFDLNHQKSEGNSNLELKYSFIKIDNTYALSKKKFWWSKKDSKSNAETYDYSSSSRCKNLNQEQYLSSIGEKQQTYNWAAIFKHPKSNKEFIATELSTKQKAINLAMKKCYKFVTNNLNKIGYNDCYLLKTSNNNSIKVSSKKIKSKSSKKKNITGSRSFALSWEGKDDLVLGTLSFSEEDMIGKLNFNLTSIDAKCFGTYVLSTVKGTWSVICEKDDMNASGTLIMNSQNGSVSGEGKDANGNLVKFKVAGSN